MFTINQIVNPIIPGYAYAIIVEMDYRRYASVKLRHYPKHGESGEGLKEVEGWYRKDQIKPLHYSYSPLEVVFPHTHELFNRIAYDPQEGQYYDRYTDLYLSLEEVKAFGIPV